MFKNIKPSIKDIKKNKFKLFFFVRNKFPYPIIEKKINCVEIKKNIISKNIILIYQLIILIFLIYFF